MSDVDSGDSPSSHSAYPSPRQGTLISAIVFTFFAVVVTVSLLYILLRQNRRNSSIDNTSTSAAAGNTATTSSSYHQNGKLKPEVLDSLPVFVYPLMPHGEKLECAVCLADFREGEMGRVLPRCLHRFHTVCIDMWLDSHFTCPICRVRVTHESPDSAV